MSINKTKQKLIYILVKCLYNGLDAFSSINLFRKYIIQKKLYWGTTLLSFSFFQSIGNSNVDYISQNDNNKVSGGNKDSTIVEVVVEEISCYITVEELATFQGGDLNLFRNWVQQQLIYPQECEYEGRVMVQFVVNAEGNVDKVQIIQSSGDSLLDNEAVRVIKSSPQWKPAIWTGKKQNQQFLLPVMFKLFTTK